MEETPKPKKGRKLKVKEIEKSTEKKEEFFNNETTEEKSLTIEQAGELVGKESVGDKKIISEPNHNFDNILISFWNFLTSLFKF